MAIIRLKRSDKIAIHMEFNLDGASALLGLLKAAENGCTHSVSIRFDRGVTKKKRFSNMIDRTLCIIQSEHDAIEEVGSYVHILFEQETIEYAKLRFEDCLKENKFWPAELCELTVAGSRNTENDLYCILLECLNVNS